MNRYFTAIDLPEETKKSVYSYFYPLLTKYFYGSFTTEEKLHITLVFLGDIEIKKEFIDFIKGLKISHDIIIKGVDAFPNLENPKVLYAKVNNDLSPITKRITEFIGIDNKQHFIPHITLCRIKRIKDAEFHIPEKEFTFHADKIDIFNSDFKNYYKLS